jgi:pyridoxal phosphate enzyme (YggS family)
MIRISDRLEAVNNRIKTAAIAAGRQPDAVALLAVSKTFGPESVLEAVQAGQRDFGENYVQEALDKIDALKKLAPDVVLAWHFIGPIQSNKTRPIAEQFDWVHSVDREKIAQRLSEQRPDHLPPLNICLQVNISGEATKSGVLSEEVTPLALSIAHLPKLRLRGLMAVPAPSDDPAQQRAAFAALAHLHAQLQAAGLAVDTLSMGMSSDMDAAIAEGATMVRIGSAIFGQRHYP